MYNFARTPIASLLAVVLFGQSIVACSGKQSPQHSRIMARSAETELEPSVFESDNDSKKKAHEQNVSGSDHEWFQGSEGAQVSPEEQKDIDEKVKNEAERVRQGETTGDLSLARGASPEARNALMREMYEQTEKRIRDLKKDLEDAGIYVPIDGSGPGGSTSSVRPDEGKSPSDGSGSGHGNATPSELAAAAKQLETQIEVAEKAITRLEQERHEVEKRVSETRKELDEQRAESERLIQEANTIQGRIDSNGSTGQTGFDTTGQEQQEGHNTGVRAALGALPAGLTKAVMPREGDGTRPEDDLPESSAKASIQHERRKITLLEGTSTTPESKKAFERTHNLLNAAAKYANAGDVERTKRRLQEAGKLSNQAAGMAGRNLSGVPDDDGLDRGQVETTALDLYDAGSALDDLGLGTVADLVIEHASELMNVAYDGARMLGAIDAAANAMEAFAGKTIDFNEKGEPFLRETTNLERGFAIASLGLMAAGALIGGPVGVAATGMISRIGKAVIEREVKHAAAEAAEKALAKGLGTVEREAAERAAREVAEQKASAAVKAAEDNAARANMASIDNPKIRTHILDGDFAPDGKLKGGMHTGDATDAFIERLPADVKAQVSRETLPNGVERVVFPEDGALTREAFNATKGAADAGRGMAGGKTLFPRPWNARDINDAIEHISKNGQIVSENVKRGTKVLTGEWNGVRVEVAMGLKKGGGFQVNSAYPSWVQ